LEELRLITKHGKAVSLVGRCTNNDACDVGEEPDLGEPENDPGKDKKLALGDGGIIGLADYRNE
jgi:hypothetical protein